MYSELASEFFGQKVVDYNGPGDWKGPTQAYRLREEYDDEKSIADRLQSLLEQPGAAQLSALIIGAWTGSAEGNDSAAIVQLLVGVADRLPGLRALFFGEMTYEECEISWINQSDVSPLLGAFPKLETFRVRGGSGLSFSRIAHQSLRELGVETGGLSRSTIREILLCVFPALERLELQLGEENYGFDGSVEDFQPLLAGSLFPKLKYLGLTNSEIANDIAAVVVNSPIAKRVETLDLSLGNLDATGVESLKGLAGHGNLKSLVISHHYADPKQIAALTSALPFQVVAEDPQEPEDEWRPIVHSE
jgi:hypothetical protein